MARNNNPLTALTGIFSKLESQVEKTNELLDEAVDLLFSIDKKLDKQRGGSTKIEKGAGKEIAIALDGITNLVKEINKSDSKKVDEVLDKIVKGVGKLDDIAKGFNENAAAFNKNLLGLGVAILGFAAAILLATPALILGIPAMLITAGTIWLFSKLFSSIDTKKFKEGSDAMLSLAKSVAILGISFLVFRIVEVSDILKAGLGILVVGGALALLAKVSKGGKEMENAAKALMFAGISIASIGLGMWLFQKLDIQLETIAMAGVAVVGTGLALALAGKFWTHIAKGALVMSLAALPLILIGFSLDLFAKSIGKVQQSSGMGPWEFLGLVAGTIATIGVEMGLAGLALPFIAAGAGAMILAGGAIYAISAGLERFASINFDESQSEKLTYALGAIRAAFLGTDGKEDEGFFSKLGGVFTGAMDSVRMIEAAAGFGAAGLALIGLSKGLEKFKELNFSAEDSTQLSLALSSVTSAFAQAGGEPANPGGIFGAVFGNMFSPNAVERGIDSVMGAGKALTEVVGGLLSFQELVTQKIDFDVLGEAIKKTLGFVSSAFANIGSPEMEDPDGWFIFSWDENRVAKGIDAVSGAGKELTNIATGLKSFQELVDAEVDFDVLSKAISTTLTLVGNAFAKIGGDETEDGWFVFSWDENRIAKGIDAVSGAGEELTNIATGLKSFQELVDAEIDWSKLGGAISKSLSFVGTAFAKIGGMEEEDGWFVFKWDENLVQKGIENVKGAGAELSNIATGLKTFADIEDPAKVAQNIDMLFGSIFAFFEKQANNENGKLQNYYFKTFATGLKTIADRHDKLGKSASHLENISKSMGKFKDNVNSFDLEKLTMVDSLFNNMKQLSKIDGSLTDLGEEITSAIEEAFEKLQEYLAEFQGSGTTRPTQITTPTPGSGNPVVTTQQNKQQTIDISQLANKIDGLRTAILAGIPVTVSNIRDLQ